MYVLGACGWADRCRLRGLGGEMRRGVGMGTPAWLLGPRVRAGSASGEAQQKKQAAEK